MAEWGLFLSSFLAATLLPGGSEIALLAYLHEYPQHVSVALILATVGNTLGGLSSYLLGRLIPERATHLTPRAHAWLNRFGSPALLLAWAPVIGDALCVLAGAVRLPAWPAAIYMALGKALRYAVIALPWWYGV